LSLILDQQTFFGVTIVSVILLSSSAAFLQGSVAGLASIFPPQCMHAMVSGQAVSGLFATLAQLLSLAGNWKVIDSAFYYFLLADITIIIALVMYLLINKTVSKANTRYQLLLAYFLLSLKLDKLK